MTQIRVQGNVAEYYSPLAFVLDQIVQSSSTGSLVSLLDDQSAIAGIGGDPGWMVERRKPAMAENGDVHWPQGAEFRVLLGEECRHTWETEQFYSSAEFHQCLHEVLVARKISVPKDRDA